MYCNNKKALSGFNSLADIKPGLVSEWSPNNKLKADEVLPHSYNRVLWICPTCHGEYSALIRDREVGDDSCPYCKDKKVLPGYNSLEVTNPELALEWSKNNTYSPSEFIKSSSFLAMWTCPKCGGDYLHSIKSRELNDDSCPYCRNKKILKGFNSLVDVNPELANEWSINNKIKPTEVLTTSYARVLWMCPTCHGEYSYSIRDRSVGDDSCPYCRNKKILPGYNSLKARHEELVSQEWCYAENILLGVDPDNILESYDKKVWWKCQICGRKYIMTVKDRLMKKKRGHIPCQQCNGRRWKRRFNV